RHNLYRKGRHHAHCQKPAVIRYAQRSVRVRFVCLIQNRVFLSRKVAEKIRLRRLTTRFQCLENDNF
ncbi:hypothetical protein, partial [Klebsiella pneumoniae]|uniref:hypothetical protein n=1 Tax=Klebsiella pneumoniae TaxID=573 RepID=UPI003A813194